jgi:hypothetical protein
MNEFVDADDEPRAELVAFLDAVVNEVRVLYPSLLQHNDVYGRVLRRRSAHAGCPALSRLSRALLSGKL